MHFIKRLPTISLARRTTIKTFCSTNNPQPNNLELSEDSLRLYSELILELCSNPHLLPLLCEATTVTELEKLFRILSPLLFDDTETIYNIPGSAQMCVREETQLALVYSVLRSVVKDTETPEALLAPGTVLSRVLSIYVHQSGSGWRYLVSTLSSQVSRVYQYDQLNVEVDPSVVYEQMAETVKWEQGSLPSDMPSTLSFEDAAANANVQAIIEPRKKMLTDIATTLLNAVLNSRERIPFGIRYICQALVWCIQERFPSASRDAAYDVAGDFLFKIIVCPSLEDPSTTFGNIPAVKDCLYPGNPHRTLTLVSELLCQLGTSPLSEEAGVVRAPSEPLPGLLDTQRGAVRAFLTDLCREPFGEQLYWKGKTITARNVFLRKNDIFFLHYIVVKGRGSIIHVSSESFRQVMRKLGLAPTALPPQDNTLVELQFPMHRSVTI